MFSCGQRDNDEEFSVIADDEGKVGFLDFEDDKSIHGFDSYDGNPIVISNPFQFSHGKPQSGFVGETCADAITLRNTTGEPVDLWSVRIFASNPTDCYILSLMKPPTSDQQQGKSQSFVGSTSLEDRVLQPGQALTIWLSCKPKEIGMHTAVVHFDVGDEKIEKVAFLLADDKISQALASEKPYRKIQRKRGSVVDQYVAGSRPSRAKKQEFRYVLPQFAIPPDIRELVKSKQVPDILMTGLNVRNYAKFFSTLIIMEEIHLEEEMRRHDMDNVTMKKRGYFLCLEVPGLAERRPSLVCGDCVFAKLEEGNEHGANQTYQGYIHRVAADEIFLKFASEFHYNHRDKDFYNISFTYNRINMRRLYQAVNEAESMAVEFLFPSQSRKRRIVRKVPFTPLNPNINMEQLSSVERILGCYGGPPYVIYGPPGTGKTMMLVEAILQLYKTRKDARILVCASSNSAADHVLEKLIGACDIIHESKLFRLNASSRPYEDVRSDFIRFCFFKDMVFQCPPMNALLRYRIIVCTYMSSSLLYAIGICCGHFTHIFLDEAGQASEPETMVPIANLCNRETVVVLAGDPKQLGPVIYSKDAGFYGLEKSYLERLFEYEFYESEDENYVTKLIRNYRCHPVILELPSRFFYKGELIACREEDDSSIYDILELPNSAFPVLFIGIQGCDEREGSNPSWFNRIEASKIVEIIRKLIRSIEINECDIGVITPYRQQVLKIRKTLDNLEMPDIKVGSVEQFQGQERKVIIISTVRSTIKHNEFDRVHNLGFLSHAQRFNVAVTRARSLLIIVGNPHIITKDRHWDALLRHCAENGSYQGCTLPPPEMHDHYRDRAFDSTIENHQGLYPNETEWEEYIPEQYPNPYSSDVAWPEDHPAECSIGIKCENGYERVSNDVKWGDDLPSQ